MMDVLSSQANLAGYRAVIDAAAEYGRALPMMMTAAGAVSGRQGLHHGRGRRRSAGDRHPRAGSAPSSPPPTCARRPRNRSSRSAPSSSPSRTRSSSRPRPRAATPRKCRTPTGPSRAALVAAHIAKQDIVIATALIPGRPAPRLGQRPTWSVDARRLGDRRSRGRTRRNCELARAGEVVVTDNGVRVVGDSSVTRLAATASASTRAISTPSSETLIDKAARRSPSIGTTNSSRRRA